MYSSFLILHFLRRLIFLEERYQEWLCSQPLTFLCSTLAQNQALKPKHCPQRCSFSLSSHSLNISLWHPNPAKPSPSWSWLANTWRTIYYQKSLEAQQIYYMTYLSLSQKIKKCHCSILWFHERHKTTKPIQASKQCTTSPAKLNSK